MANDQKYYIGNPEHNWRFIGTLRPLLYLRTLEQKTLEGHAIINCMVHYGNNQNYYIENPEHNWRFTGTLRPLLYLRILEQKIPDGHAFYHLHAKFT